MKTLVSIYLEMEKDSDPGQLAFHYLWNQFIGSLLYFQLFKLHRYMKRRMSAVQRTKFGSVVRLSTGLSKRTETTLGLYSPYILNAL
jgi:hypothetical protein